jgi:Rhodopirellula transposase DDE domain
MQPLLWTSRSLRNLAKELAQLGHKVCPTVVGNLLRELGYSLQANHKTREADSHIDRDAQFGYINTQATAFLRAGQPVISVDTKKKELVANYRNNGREWRAKGKPEKVNVHDLDPHLRAISSSRRIQHQGQRRHRYGACHRQIDRRDAGWPHPGRIDLG